MIGGGLLAALGALALIAPTASSAQEPSATDPSPGSPSGTIYALPVDTGRIDAAPLGASRGEGDAEDGGSGSDGVVSTFRSENDFGTSSVVPGASGPAGPGDHEGGGGARLEPDSGLGLTGGEGSDPSEPLSLLLLAALLAIGLFLGVISSRAPRSAASR